MANIKLEDSQYFKDQVKANVPKTYAMRFSRSVPGQNVYCGRFWKINTIYTDFMINVLCLPLQGAEYHTSASHSGGHFVLAGFSGGNANTIGGLSNWLKADNSGNVDMQCDSGRDPWVTGNWVVQSFMIHTNANTGGKEVVLMWDGVPSRRRPKNGGRSSPNDYDTALYFGSAGDHSGFEGWVRYAQIMENAIPFGGWDDTVSFFRPTLRPRYKWADGAKKFNLLMEFGNPFSEVILDSSQGHEGSLHHGTRGVGTRTEAYGVQYSSQSEAILSQWEEVMIENRTYSLPYRTPPAGAWVYDFYNRTQNITYLWSNTLGLGNTEGGSLGPVAWQNSQNCGVITGKFYHVGGYASPPYLQNLPSSNMLLEVDNIGNETGYGEAYIAYDFTTNTGIKAVQFLDNNTLTLYKVVNGVQTNLGYYATGAGATGEGVPYRLGLEYTSTQHIKLIVDGIVRLDIDDSANPALTGRSASIGSVSPYVRMERLAISPATA